MVDALVYGTGLLQVEVKVGAWFLALGYGLRKKEKKKEEKR
jgi:hypothetical protein